MPCLLSPFPWTTIYIFTIVLVVVVVAAAAAVAVVVVAVGEGRRRRRTIEEQRRSKEEEKLQLGIEAGSQQEKIQNKTKQTKPNQSQDGRATMRVEESSTDSNVRVLGGMGPDAGIMFQQKIHEAHLKTRSDGTDQSFPSVLLHTTPAYIGDRTQYLSPLTRTNANPGIAAAHLLMDMARSHQRGQLFMRLRLQLILRPPHLGRFQG